LVPGTVNYIIFGRETGESGTPHLQGYVQFDIRKRFTQVVQLLSGAHVTVARNSSAAREYCKKEGNFEEHGIYKKHGGRRGLDDFKTAVKDGMTNLKAIRENHSSIIARYPKFVIDYIRDNQKLTIVQPLPLLDWQENLLNLLKEPPDNRKIIFVVDHDGNRGKSWFCKYVYQTLDHVQILVPGKKADMAICIQPDIQILFLDAPRAKQGEYIQYDFLEEIKNGYVFSSKYESHYVFLEAVHVVVMMNEEPDRTKLSADRYQVITI
jgi:hypothetical protein